MLSISNNMRVVNSVPMRFSRNQQLLLNCIEHAALAADKKDLALLASSKNSGDKKLIKDTALRVEKATHNKMLEFEGSSEEMNNRASRSKKPLVTGLGTRIKTKHLGRSGSQKMLRLWNCQS